MKYVLIWMVLNVGTSSQEFDSLKACEEAKGEVLKMMRFRHHEAVCVPKGKEE